MKKKTKTKIKKAAKKASGAKVKDMKKPIRQAQYKGIIPLGDRVLVRPFDPDEMTTTASGIIIPDTVSKEKPEQGEVIAVGDGKWDDGVRAPMSVKVGDRVMFSKYGYDEIKYEGREYYILREESILAIIN